MKKAPGKPPTLTFTDKKPQLRKPTSVTLDPAAWIQIDMRGTNRSEQISQDLMHYYRLLAETRRALRAQFDNAEISLIINACDDWVSCGSTSHYLWMEVGDAIRLERLDHKWKIKNPEELIRKIQQLTELQSLALADAVTRWYVGAHGERGGDPGKALD